MKKNVLVFPCGSEIGLEIYRSVRYSNHFNLIGGSSTQDHGVHVYKEYIPDIPYADAPDFIHQINLVIAKFKIDLLYPTMDSVMATLWEAKDQLDCVLVGSSAVTNTICLSKKKTTDLLVGSVAMPKIYSNVFEVKSFPVFLKPEIGYSSRGTAIAFSKEEVAIHLQKRPDCLLMEYLPGDEYTIDCFTDKARSLLFVGARLRSRIANGISVNTKQVDDCEETELKKVAVIINNLMHFRGAWFFQAKKGSRGEFKVMEVAPRLAGSSAMFRAKGINFALLTLWDTLDVDIGIIENNYDVEMDRALDNKFKIEIGYNRVYVDLDDTLIIDARVNLEMISFLYQCRNEQKEIICLSRYAGDISAKLEQYRLTQLFDRVIHLRNKELKSEYIEVPAIFIDDSFAERKQVASSKGIPVFSPDMVPVLMR